MSITNMYVKFSIALCCVEEWAAAPTTREKAGVYFRGRKNHRTLISIVGMRIITTYNTFTIIYHCIVTKHLYYYIVKYDSLCDIETGQVGLVVWSCSNNRTTAGSPPKCTRFYFVILLKNVDNFFDWHWYNRRKDAFVCRYFLNILCYIDVWICSYKLLYFYGKGNHLLL